MKLTKTQRLWLLHRDRNEEDVLKDNKGLYVLMWNGETKEIVRIYLPIKNNIV